MKGGGAAGITQEFGIDIDTPIFTYLLYKLKYIFFKRMQGLPWQSSGQNYAFPVQGAWVGSLVGW